MFSPEDCIGIEAADYLLDLGFDISVDSEYVGMKTWIQRY